MDLVLKNVKKKDLAIFKSLGFEIEIKEDKRKRW
jgi:hypothetical protein